MDWGKFRDALDYGHHQLGISEELDNPQMRSEAYLNLARAHEKLGNERQFFKLIPVSSLSSHLIFFFASFRLFGSKLNVCTTFTLQRVRGAIKEWWLSTLNSCIRIFRIRWIS